MGRVVKVRKSEKQVVEVQGFKLQRETNVLSWKTTVLLAIRLVVVVYF